MTAVACIIEIHRFEININYRKHAAMYIHSSAQEWGGSAIFTIMVYLQHSYDY